MSQELGNILLEAGQIDEGSLEAALQDLAAGPQDLESAELAKRA